MFDKFLAQYTNPNAKLINTKIINDMRNESLVDYIIDAFKSLEIIKHIKMIGYEHIEDESKFDSDIINRKHLKSKMDKNIEKRISIDVSRFSLLKVRFKLNLNGFVKYKNVELLLLKRYKNYYLMLGGNKFYPIYQLVDSSTYNNKDYITLKSMFMPIIIKRNVVKLDEFSEKSFSVPYYSLFLFKKKCNPLMYYLATMGFNNTMIYMGTDDIISVVDTYDNDNQCYYFKTNKGYYVKVVKFFFDNDHFTQSTVYSVYDMISDNSFNMGRLEDIDHWCTKLGALFTPTVNSQLEKGKSVLLSFYRLLDNTTKRNLKLKEFNKDNIYAIVRWMMRNFSELKTKDNMDLANKRIRMAEYIASYFNKSLASKVNRILSRKTISMSDLDDLLNIPQDELIKQLRKSKSPLLRYDNTVNDMDLFTALKYSVKGPGSLGESSSNAVNIKYRGIHPSHVGPIDINTSGTSDPGMGGIFTPFVKTYGQYFSPLEEPQTWDDNYLAMKKKYFNQEDIPYKSLNYFYKMEKKVRKIVKRLEDVFYFIKNDEYYVTSDNILELNDKLKMKRIVRVRHLDEPQQPETKRGRKKSDVRKIKVRHIGKRGRKKKSESS